MVAFEPQGVERGAMGGRSRGRGRRGGAPALGWRRHRQAERGGRGQQRRAGGFGPVLVARIQPFGVRHAGPGRRFQRPQRFGAACLVGAANLRLEGQLGQDHAGTQHTGVKGALVPLGQRALALQRQLDRDVGADQLARLGAALLRGAVEPVQGSGQALGQARAAI